MKAHVYDYDAWTDCHALLLYVYGPVNIVNIVIGADQIFSLGGKQTAIRYYCLNTLDVVKCVHS